ncbi:MAG: hypothetical protein HY294_09430 [Candidatus Rokubacteria bacterium]|nr:hypothetical protein [Candidatus Rokubacteria bacterium]MBI3826207.1 hypothetical protein [Candidatus Rokubacteria bacterium]
MARIFGWMVFVAEILVGTYAAGMALWSHSQLTNAIENTIEEGTRGGRLSPRALKETLLRKATELGVRLEENSVVIEDGQQTLDIHISWLSPVLTIAARDWLVIPMTIDKSVERPAGRR